MPKHQLLLVLLNNCSDLGGVHWTALARLPLDGKGGKWRRYEPAGNVGMQTHNSKLVKQFLLEFKVAEMGSVVSTNYCQSASLPLPTAPWGMVI